MEYSLIILGTMAVYLALFAHVAFSPKVSKNLICAAGAVAVVFGLIFYGICFASLYDNLILAILKTCQAVLQLFLGENPLAVLAGSPLLERPFMQIVFSALGFLGIFTTTGAALSAIGANFLRKLRIYLQKSRDLAIIQPLNAKTLGFARELITKKKVAVIFADKTPDSTCVTAAQELGCVIRSDSDAINGTESFLRSIGAHRQGRKLSLFALGDDRFANRTYAGAIADGAQALNIPDSHTSLSIFAGEGLTSNAFTSRDGQYSFGTNLCISPEHLAARLLMQKSPVWEAIDFDEEGRATEDFHGLVIGGGKVGQSVIKQLVMNGQFAGSQFHLSVFDPDFQKISGQLFHESHLIFVKYQIQVYDHDARSCQMYDFLQTHLHALKYIVICTGDDLRNREVAQQLHHYLENHGVFLPLHICSRRSVQKITASGIRHWDIFSCRMLCSDDMDKMAMQLHHSYCAGNGKTAQENWADCDYFSRMSSRASADYAPAFLKMAGLPADTIPSGNWYTPQQLENMAISEHERWCAFHYCMGFRPMTKEEYAERCRIYKEEKSKNPASRYRIGKDVGNRIHSCLIPWEELDALSARENAVTGGNVDYKQMDRNNVLTLPVLLKSVKE